MTGDFIVHFFLCSQCRLAVGNVHKVFARLSIDVMLAFVISVVFPAQKSGWQ